MPSEITEEFRGTAPVLLFVATKGHQEAVNKRLENLVSHRLLHDGSVLCVFLSSEEAKNPLVVYSKVRKIFPLKRRVWVIPVGGINASALWTRLGKNAEIKSIENAGTFLRDKLKDFLYDFGLTWQQDQFRALNQWIGGKIQENDISKWVNQFDLLEGNSNRWIGINLLRSLEIWNHHELFQGLNDSEMLREDKTTICILRYENGKSSDQVSSILKKGLGPALKKRQIQNLVDALERENCDDPIIVAEDGLFSGVEWAGIIESLLGLREHEHQKCDPLSNPNILSKKDITIHFAVATDLGHAYLISVLEQQKLLNIKVTFSRNGFQSVLTKRGRERMQEKALYKILSGGVEVIEDPNSNIDFVVFRNPIWGDKKDKAIAACRKIGLDLWKDYLHRKGKNWVDERLNDVALGSSNMAFAFAFSHSVPKATLPLFWCSGKVSRSNGESFDWVPLFPNAE